MQNSDWHKGLDQCWNEVEIPQRCSVAKTPKGSRLKSVGVLGGVIAKVRVKVVDIQNNL